MFKVIRIALLLFILFAISINTWLTQARSTDWSDSLWVRVYPINGDGSAIAARYIAKLDARDFAAIESFLQRETERYGHSLERPVRVDLARPVTEQPPALPDSGNPLVVMWWSLRMRHWAGSVTAARDEIAPDVQIFVRYHAPDRHVTLDNSVGLQKGMIGIVNGYASRKHQGTNSLVIAHEFLHTLGATDKYHPANGQPLVPHGLAEPERQPLYPQRFAEIMGGRVALAADDAVIPTSLDYAVIGPGTAREIGLID